MMHLKISIWTSLFVFFFIQWVWWSFSRLSFILICKWSSWWCMILWWKIWIPSWVWLFRCTTHNRVIGFKHLYWSNNILICTRTIWWTFDWASFTIASFVTFSTRCQSIVTSNGFEVINEWLAPWGIIYIFCVIICNVGKINIVLETYMNEGYGIWYHNGWIGYWCMKLNYGLYFLDELYFILSFHEFHVWNFYPLIRVASNPHHSQKWSLKILKKKKKKKKKFEVKTFQSICTQ